MNKAGMKSLRGEAAGTHENAPGEAADLRSVPASESRPHSSSWVLVWTFSSTQSRTRASFRLLLERSISSPGCSSGLLWAPPGGSSGLLQAPPQSSSSLFPAVLPPCGEVLYQHLSSPIQNIVFSSQGFLGFF